MFGCCCGSGIGKRRISCKHWKIREKIAIYIHGISSSQVEIGENASRHRQTVQLSTYPRAYNMSTTKMSICSNFFCCVSSLSNPSSGLVRCSCTFGMKKNWKKKLSGSTEERRNESHKKALTTREWRRNDGFFFQRNTLCNTL